MEQRLVARIDWSYEEKKRSIIMIVVLISFFCSLPFLSFIIRSDWEKMDSVEILQQKNPKGYEQYVEDFGSDTSFITPSMRYFITPSVYTSALLGSPFIMFMAVIIYSFQFIISVWMMLPKIAKFILSTIFKVVFLIVASALAQELYYKIKNLFRRK